MVLSFYGYNQLQWQQLNKLLKNNVFSAENGNFRNLQKYSSEHVLNTFSYHEKTLQHIYDTMILVISQLNLICWNHLLTPFDRWAKIVTYVPAFLMILPLF